MIATLEAVPTKPYYSLDGQTWTKIGQTLQVAYTRSHSMGCRFSLFNFTIQTPDGSVDFDFFRMSDKTSGE